MTSSGQMCVGAAAAIALLMGVAACGSSDDSGKDGEYSASDLQAVTMTKGEIEKEKDPRQRQSLCGVARMRLAKLDESRLPVEMKTFSANVDRCLNGQPMDAEAPAQP